MTASEPGSGATVQHDPLSELQREFRTPFAAGRPLHEYGPSGGDGLNARAITSLERNVGRIQSDVRKPVQEMGARHHTWRPRPRIQNGGRAFGRQPDYGQVQPAGSLPGRRLGRVAGDGEPGAEIAEIEFELLRLVGRISFAKLVPTGLSVCLARLPPSGEHRPGWRQPRRRMVHSCSGRRRRRPEAMQPPVRPPRTWTGR